MDDVIVVAGATHREGMLDKLEAQLEAAGVPFHLEMVEPMPHGPNSMTMSRKAAFVKQMAWSFAPFYRRLFIVDAFDVQFVGTKEGLMEWSFDMMFAAERNAYPEADLEGRITGPTPWKYVNAGCMCGSPAFLYMWSHLVESQPDLNILDQMWLNRRIGSTLAPLDTMTRMFYVVSQAAEDGSLQLRNGRLWNSKCDTNPQFLHFSGKCPDTYTHLMESK